MKKFFLVALVLFVAVAMAVPAMALENVFGGYWRTRMYTQQNFDGNDEPENTDLSRVDTRTRLYYTAIINDNLKFVNKFEMDAVWGQGGVSYGDFGADGVAVEVKNTYADFTIGAVNAKVGVQGLTLGRGFLFSDDFSGMIISFNGEGFSIPLVWMKPWEGNNVGLGHNKQDADWFGIAPSFKISNMNISPYIVYIYSGNGEGYVNSITDIAALGPNTDTVNLFFAGFDLDFKMDAAWAWMTAIYEGGSIDLKNLPAGAPDSVDVSAWLAAIGGGFNFGIADIHGQVFYATGEDLEDDDEDMNMFFVPTNYGTGPYYPWAQIMGEAIFDPAAGNYRAIYPGYKPENIFAANIGTKVKPMADLTIAFDVWWAQLAEERPALWDPKELVNDLGVELDLVITYQLVQNLNLDIVGAYLFAGDAVWDGENDADPYEVGTRLSFSF